MLAWITGGAASGKSEYAERLAVSLHRRGGGPLCYLAAMLPTGAEAEERIRRHRALRAGKGFSTRECLFARCLDEAPAGGTLLLECLSNLLANERFEPQGSGEGALAAISGALGRLVRRAGNLVVVTNRIDADGRAYAAGTQAYLRDLAALDRIWAARADFAAEVVCSLPVVLRGVEP